MKKEIVYTDKYALILSDDIMVDNDYYAYHICEQLCINNDHYLFPKGAKKIIAHLPLSDAPILEGVPLLPPLPKEDDVNKLAYEKWKKSDERSGNPPYIYGIGFYEGYNKAKEKYKYTEEDVRRAIEMSKDIKYVTFSIDEIIQSLQQPSRATHFECEMEDYGHYQIGVDDFVKHGEKPKTTTNSQGQIELVGKYLNL